MRDANYNLAAAIGSTRRSLLIPAFAYASTWSGVSQLLARYAINNTNPFSIRRPIEQPNNTFVAAVSWAESPYVYRYKLTASIGEVLYFPKYKNEQIGPSAYIEIWDVNGQSVAIADDWTIYVSELIMPSLCICQENTAETTLTAHVPSALPPYQYCNPFCSPLCT